MFEINDKRRLYQLIDMYLSGGINASTFCDEFYACFCLEMDYTTLTEIENKIFDELEAISSRFSEFEEDHQKHPHTYYTEAELRNKIIEAKEKLKNSSMRI